VVVAGRVTGISAAHIDQQSIHYHSEKRQLAQLTHTGQLWGFKSEGGLGPNAYTHALFADFDLAGRK
jgi:hypothetical protein